MVEDLQFYSSTLQMYVPFCLKNSGCNNGLKLAKAVILNVYKTNYTEYLIGHA